MTDRNLQPGDWLYASWGYEQTNATFWLVTKRTAKTVWFQPYWNQPGQVHVELAGRSYVGVVPDETNPKIDHVFAACDNDLRNPFSTEGCEDGVCLVHKEYRRKVQDPGTSNEGVWVQRPFLWATKWDGLPKYDTIAAGHPGH